MGGPTLYNPIFVANGTAGAGTYQQCYNIVTTGSDADVQIPATVAGGTGTLADNTSWWYIVVSGAATYINYNAAAASDGTCALLPQGMLPLPVRIAPGTTVHALCSSGAGQVSLVPAKIGQ